MFLQLGLGDGHSRCRLSVLSMALIHLAKRKNIEWFDTAQQYGAGAAEKRLGNHLRNGKIISKVGLMGSLDKSDLERWIDIYRAGALLGFLNESLERLRRDQIDVYLLHCIDKTTDFSTHIEAMRTFRDRQVVKNIGFSVDHEDDLPKDFSWADAIEMPINLLTKIEFSPANKVVILNGFFRDSGGPEILRKNLFKLQGRDVVLLIGTSKVRRLIAANSLFQSLKRELKI